MKRKLIGMVATVLTIVATGFTKEKTVNDGTIGKYTKIEPSMAGTKDYDAIVELEYNIKFPNGPQMVEIPGKDFEILETEVTQKMYTDVMGENPSYRKGDNLPVEKVSWYDAIVFCNCLSVKEGLTPVYAVDGKTNTAQWNYTPHKGDSIGGSITQNTKATGYRLPTVEEWQYAAKGGQNYRYAGSDNLDEVGWYYSNSGSKTHSVGEKKTNGYGLYDMSGNVFEWCWDLGDYSDRCRCGGSWYDAVYSCKVSNKDRYDAYGQGYHIGFRIVRSATR